VSDLPEQHREITVLFFFRGEGKIDEPGAGETRNEFCVAGTPLPAAPATLKSTFLAT
jgi:hypothetical protein